MTAIKTLRTVIPAALNSIRQGSTMLAVMGYTNRFGELADFGIVFHVNYLKAVKRSIEIWAQYKPIDPLEAQARKDLIASYELSLLGHNPRAFSAHAYAPITDGQQLIKGVKWFDGGSTIHLWGFLVHKRILRRGNYPTDQRSSWAICRERLIGLTPLSRFRQFRISDGQFKKISVEKLELTHLDLLRYLA